MGWVNDRLHTYPRFTPKLWDKLRDSIATAVSEFNGSISNAHSDFLEFSDCTAMGPYCRRVEKRLGPSIEVFLDEKTKTLRTSKPDNAVCGYRAKADNTGLEFFLAAPVGPIGITVEEACKIALEDFLFPPSAPVEQL